MARETKTAPAPRWLSMADVAAMYDVSVFTVRRRISDGTVPARRVGRQLRIREDHAENLARPVPAVAAR